MIKFILNNKDISTELPQSSLLLDFIRYNQRITGTKIGCREGDCGACTVLVGELIDGKLKYHSATSCLMPLGNAMGKHIVTIEGVNVDGLNLIQQSFAEVGATQCGFCTPGFIVSLAGFCLDEEKNSFECAIDSVNGNICRCTGYKSIERATKKISDKIHERQAQDPVEFAVANNILPAYFKSIQKRLEDLSDSVHQHKSKDVRPLKFVGGGTDLYVQQHETIVHEDIELLFDRSHLNEIVQQEDICMFGASVTVADIADSPVFQKYFPDLNRYVRLVSSTQIRNMATIAGNIVNASPIGDFSIFFLALDAQLILSDGSIYREVPLRKFYKGYKQLDKSTDEYIERIYFRLPVRNTLFNFEKVSKRTNLDIASVNTAIQLKVEDGIITDAGIAAGGVAPVPFFMGKSSAFLSGKGISEELIHQLIEIVQTEVKPISDARGTETYKRLLLTQLIKAHFITLFPELETEKLIKK